jgi:phage/plasmid-like protein (TIGR03299 family)
LCKQLQTNTNNKTQAKMNREIQTNERVFELLESTGTNWSVEKQPLLTNTGITTESFGIIRKDNNTCLGTVKGLYKPMQNSTLAQTLVEASAGIGTDFRGGLLQAGRKVYYQIALPDHKVANDTIKRHITALNSHDGSSSIGFGTSNTVVVCQNTFWRAMKEVSHFRHTMSAAARIQAAAEDLKNAFQFDCKVMESFSRMAELTIQKPIFEKVISSLFKTEVQANVKPEDVGSRKRKQMTQFNEVLHSELASHGETLWGLFNAVTFWENHVAVKEERKMDSIYVGGGARQMNRTFDEIMAWVEEHTAEPVLVG